MCGIRDPSQVLGQVRYIYLVSGAAIISKFLWRDMSCPVRHREKLELTTASQYFLSYVSLPQPPMLGFASSSTSSRDDPGQLPQPAASHPPSRARFHACLKSRPSNLVRLAVDWSECPASTGSC
ncbi:hypothetical protein RRG08_037955 [Elysia crispata]|uniref:Uncharacterized protein n=1 Tax=Elysia crispata TaxID=231223 RepID=A0AAE1ABT2_9GAST|nr:hypothetical protein RRG08_037955 [Elysia crispata]